jgi:type II secretory pathway component PulL
MIATLEERKINLLSQIEKLRREIDGLKWLEYRELALCNCTGSVRYLVLDRLQENSRN